jgi:hypothetical protein
VSLTDPGPPETPAVAARPAPLAGPTAKAPLEPEPEPAAPGDLHPTAFRADFKLPFTLGALFASGDVTSSPFAPIPQLILGFRSGRWSFGAGIGLTHLQESAEFGESTSLNEVLIAPTLTVDVFQSNDGKVAFYLLGAPIFGIVLESNETSPGSDLGFQFAAGVSYALHPNFRIGMEAGPVGHFYNLPNGLDSPGETLSSINLYTALVATFAYPR